MTTNRDTRERQEFVRILSRGPHPGPACAGFIDPNDLASPITEMPPWLSDHYNLRRDAAQAVTNAYRQATDGIDQSRAAQLAKDLAAGIANQAADYTRRQYIIAAQTPAHHPDSHRNIMLAAAEMQAEESQVFAQNAAIAIASAKTEQVHSALEKIARRALQAEDAVNTGKVIYTGATDPQLARRIHDATAERINLLANDVARQMRRVLPELLGMTNRLTIFHLYGQPRAIAAYADFRKTVLLEADLHMTDTTVATVPWPIHHNTEWTPNAILQELLHLQDKKARYTIPWDGTIEFF